MEFARPDLRVYALPLLALLVLAMVWSRAMPGWARRGVSWCLRGAALVLCLIGLSLPEVRRDLEEEKALVLIVDVSASIPRAERERAASEAKEVVDALRHLPPPAEPPTPALERLLGGGDRPQGLDEEFLRNSGRTSTALIAFAGQAEIVASSRGGAFPWGAEVERSLLDDDACAALDPLHSRITPALTLAASLFPGIVERRVLVWTDGRLEEPAASASEWRAASGARSIAVYPLGPDAPRDVRVIDLQVPSEVGVTDRWNAVLSLDSTAPGEAKVTLKAGDRQNNVKTIASSDVRLAAGRQEVSFPNLQLPEGLYCITANVEMPGDAEPRNDVGLAAVRVRGKYRMLVVEGRTDAGDALARALAAQDLTVERGGPGCLSGLKLGDYSAIVLAEVAPKDLPKATQEALRTYVEDQGGGLFVMTGPSPEMAAGYRKSILESMLSVSFREPDPPKPREDPPKPAPPRPSPPKLDPNKDPKHARVEVPDMVLLLLIDRSGSMAGKKIQLVREAALATAKTLQAEDRIGIIAFDDQPHWILPQGFVQASQLDLLEDKVSRLTAGGGTDIYAAMAEAYNALHRIDAQVKHCVVLTDGYTEYLDFEGLTTRMAREKITVSTVGIGDEFDGNLLSRIAKWGRGRFDYTNDFEEIPQIFVQETKRILSTVKRKDPAPAVPPQDHAPAPVAPDPVKPPDKVNTPPAQSSEPEPARLKLRDDVTFLTGVDLRSLPSIDKRVRLDARVGFFPMVTEDEGEPVLAAGRAGLGRTAVFASDLRGEGAPEWVKWKELPRMLAQLAKSLAAAPSERKLSTRITYRLEDRGAVLAVDVPEERMGAVKDLAQRLLWRMPEGETRDLPLDRVAPGRYETKAPLEKAGKFYVAELEQRASGGIQEATSAGIARAYDTEFARVGRDLVRFRRLLAGSGVVERPDASEACRVPAPARTTRWGYGAWFVLFAVALLPIDLAVRRWRR